MHPDFPKSLHGSGPFEGFGEVRNISAAFEGQGSWLYDHWGKVFEIRSEEDRDPMPDEACTNYAISLLAKKHEKPFFLTIGYNRYFKAVGEEMIKRWTQLPCIGILCG